MSIFVIDDHPLMREAVVMLLRRLRTSTQVIELERLATVSRAIAEHGEPELVCLDLKLPDTHGVSGVREIRQMLPDTSLIVLSASPASDYEDLARDPALELRKIYAAFGLEPVNAVSDFPLPGKQASSLNRDWKMRYLAENGEAPRVRNA